MWFVRLFLVLIGGGLVYMLVTQETIPLSSSGRISFTYSLWNEPVRFLVYFIAFAGFEWFLLRVHAGMQQEETERKQRRRGRRRGASTKR